MLSLRVLHSLFHDAACRRNPLSPVSFPASGFFSVSVPQNRDSCKLPLLPDFFIPLLPFFFLLSA